MTNQGISQPRTSKHKAVEFEAEIAKVSTLVDGTVQVTFSLPEYCNPQAAWLLLRVKDLVRVLVQEA